MAADATKLEAVFYCSPIPYDLATLTFLGLIFDRVYFPSVYIPTEAFDPAAVQAEIDRLVELKLTDYETRLLIGLMQYVLLPELREFCEFTGKHGQIFGGKEMEEANSLVSALQEQIHGPRPANFTPIFTPGHHKAINENQYIDYPGAYYYQSNALIFAAKNGIPLLNADPTLPVPGLRGETARNNSKLLAAVMAIECVGLVLPEVGSLQPAQILEAREELSKYATPFKASLLRLASSLNASIEASSDHRAIMEAARFIAETEVLPSLMELRAELQKPKKGWASRTWELTKKVPRLAAAYGMLDLKEAVPKTLEALGDWLVTGLSEDAPRSEFYFLLRLEERQKR